MVLYTMGSGECLAWVCSALLGPPGKGGLLSAPHACFSEPQESPAELGHCSTSYKHGGQAVPSIWAIVMSQDNIPEREGCRRSPGRGQGLIQ